MKDNALRRQHPVAILRYTYRYLFLLIPPLLRGMRYIRTPRGFYAWLAGGWVDIAAVILLILLPCIAWRRHTYTLDEHGFTVQKGILFRRTSFLHRHSISTLAVERPFFLRPFRAVWLSVDTDAGSRLMTDLHLTVNERQAQEILDCRQPATRIPLYCYSPRWYSVVGLSLLMSDSFSGILLLATTFQQSGRLLGEAFRNRVIGNLEDVAGYVTAIPRTAAAAALILLIGWAAAALRNMLRYLPFSATRYRGTLTIRTGLLTRRDYSCTAAAVNYLDYRQSLPSRLLRLQMVFIHCIGYGKDRHSLSVLIPAAPSRVSEQEAQRLLPEFRRRPITLRAAPFSLYRYVCFPLWGLLLLPLISRAVRVLFPDVGGVIRYLTFMALIPMLWLFAVRLIDRYTAGISREDGFYTLRYSRHFTFHTVIVPEEKVVAWSCRQTIFQKRAHNCNLLLYTYGESLRPHRVRNVPLDAVRDMLDPQAKRKD